MVPRAAGGLARYPRGRFRLVGYPYPCLLVSARASTHEDRKVETIMHDHHPFIASMGRRLSPLLWGALLPLTACGDDTGTDLPGSTEASTVDPTTTGPGTTSSTTDPGDDSTTTSPATDDSTTTSADSGDSSDSGGPGSGDTTGTAGLEILGQWVEEFAPGMTVDHTIEPQTWTQMSDFGDALFHIESYDNAARWVVAQNDRTNTFDPTLYSKFNWTWDGADLYYCTAVFNAETAADATDAPDADASDLATGCGGFPWPPTQDPLRGRRGAAAEARVRGQVAAVGSDVRTDHAQHLQDRLRRERMDVERGARLDTR